MRDSLNRLTLCSALILLAFIGALECRSTRPFALAQSPVQEKPKLKDFGSSLKRLKWDPVKKSAIETQGAADKRNGDTPEDVIRIETRLVVCDVMVLDPQGRIIRGLDKNDFVVTEDGQPQEISHFSLGDDQNTERSIVLIIDYSGSLLPYISTSVDAAKTLVDKLGPKDRMAIVTDDVALLADFTKDRDSLKQALESLKKQALSEHHLGRSEQFSALMATAKELFSEEDVRPIIIFQTDGDELNFLQPPDPSVTDQKQLRSRIKEFSLTDVYTAAEKSRATVYTVIPGVRLIGVPPSEQLERVRRIFEERLKAMPQATGGSNPSWRLPDKLLSSWAQRMLREQSAASGVAKLTGGWTTFLEEPGQAAEIYSSILSDVNSRYVVGYYPANKLHDGKRHTVLVEVRNHPEYTLWGRKFYYAPEPEQ
jgi:VWFA-related protein